MMNCEFCGSPAHVWFNCPKKPDGWKPDRLRPSSRKATSKEAKRVAPAPALAGPIKLDGGERPASIRSGTKFIAEIPEGTRLIAHGDKVAAPNLPASYVTDGGLVPIKLGRPRIHPDRKAYKAAKERERRARLKADQSKRED